MKVFVSGESECAAALRGYLKKAGDVGLTNNATDADYTIILVPSEVDSIFFDSIECELERNLLRHVRSLSTNPVGLKTFGGIQSDNTVRIFFPESEARAVELGVQMGFADFAGPGEKLTAAQGAGGSPHLKKLESLYERLAEEKDRAISAAHEEKRTRSILLAAVLLLALLLSAKVLHGQAGEHGISVEAVHSASTPTLSGGQYAPLQLDASGNLIVNCGTGCSASSGPSFGSAFPATGTAVGFISSTNTLAGGNLDASGNLKVDCTTGCSSGSLSDNGAAATNNRTGTVPAISQTNYRGGTAGTQGRDAALEVGTDGLLWTAQLPAMRPASYTASTKFAASSTTDNTCMPGNATNIALVTELRITGIQTTAGMVNAEIIKRSAADTGGTSANITAVPDDSNYAAASSQPVSYTSTGPSVGAAVGDIDNAEIGFMAAGTVAPNDIYLANWRQKPIVLRGTAQEICVNLGGAVTGGTMTATWKWIETTTITP